MPHAAKHFMWGYQQLFRTSVANGAAAILDTLKPGLKPEVFLVGVRANPDDDSPPACVEPEFHHWADSCEFYDVLEDVPLIQNSYPESQIVVPHPIAHANEQRRLFRRALRDAVLSRVEKSLSRPRDLRIFSSIPVHREGFWLLTLITVDAATLSEVPTLADDHVAISKDRSFRVPCSLVEAIIDQIFARVNEVIIQTDAGANLAVLGSTDEILRRAGLDFFSSLLHRIDQGSFMDETANVFDTVSRLSLTAYEGRPAAGTLLLLDQNKSIPSPVLKLATPVSLSHSRALRKLLVLANSGLCLQCNCESAFALVADPAHQPDSSPRGCVVRILRRGEWVTSIDDRELMTITDGYPSLPKPVVDQKRLAADLRRIIPTMTKSHAMIFAQIGTRLATSGHGALLVIAENAAEEAARLSSDGLPISPVKLTPNLSSKLAEIDGAILCAPDGNCHAIGVILDGRAVTFGDRGRGSRFNSAIRYVASNTASAALVISEDSGLDLLPKLRPALAKSELTSHLAELKRLASAPATPHDRGHEVKVISWIYRHEFYLSEKQCAQANQWIKDCEQHPTRDPKSTPRIARHPLTPDPRFDPKRDLT